MATAAAAAAGGGAKKTVARPTTRGASLGRARARTPTSLRLPRAIAPGRREGEERAEAEAAAAPPRRAHTAAAVASAEAAAQAAEAAAAEALRAARHARALAEDARRAAGLEVERELLDDGLDERRHVFRKLPKRIILVRHGESEGNVDETMYCRCPDPEILLTERGKQQAADAGRMLKQELDADGSPYKVFFYISPYARSKQTCVQIARQFAPDQIMGVREEPQLREQDFGNFQDSTEKLREKAERHLYGRFFYRFPNGESGSDVFDRITIFEDHMVRDIDDGRFPEGTNLVLVTHGLTMRIFLARWLHWTVREYERIYNPPNSFPIILERCASDESLAEACSLDGSRCDDVENREHTKNLYCLSKESVEVLKGCTEDMRGMVQPEFAWHRTLDEPLFDMDDCTCEMDYERVPPDNS